MHGHRINFFTIFNQFIMQMRAGSLACRADISDGFTLVHTTADFEAFGKTAGVSIARTIDTAVTDLNVITVTAFFTDEVDYAVA